MATRRGFSFFFFFPHPSHLDDAHLDALLFPILFVSTACIGFRFGSAASFHFPGNVGLGFWTSDWQQQQDKPLPGLLMKQISLFAKWELMIKMQGAEAQTGLRHDVLAASRWRSSWEAGCQQLTAETGVNH